MGELVQWKDEYNTGCKVIDDQHKKLFQIINELFAAFEAAYAGSQVPTILKQLEDYTVYHFQTEEKMFEQYNYPLTKEHKAEHQYFVDKIKKFKQDLETGNKQMIAFEIMMTLKDWLIDHILVNDRKYIPYLCK